MNIAGGATKLLIRTTAVGLDGQEAEWSEIVKVGVMEGTLELEQMLKQVHCTCAVRCHDLTDD